MCWVTFESPSSKKKTHEDSKSNGGSQTEELVRRVKLVEMAVPNRPSLRRSHGGVYRIAIPDTVPLLHGHRHHHHHHDGHHSTAASSASRSNYSSTRTSTTILRGIGIKRAPSPARHHHHHHHHHPHIPCHHHHHRHDSANIVLVEPPEHLRNLPFPAKCYHTLSGDRAQVREATGRALEEIRYEALRPGRARSCRVGGRDWMSTGVPWHWDCVEEEPGKKRWEKVELKYPPFGGLEKW